MAVALVTGGRKGIGRACVDALLHNGYTVIAIAKSVDANGLNCEYISCDLSITKQRHKLIERIVNKYQTIDVLINNAGYQNFGAAEKYSLDTWNRDIELMLTASFDLSQQVFPYMLNQRFGRIINMASIVSFQGARNIIGYVTAKHGVIGMTKCLSNEWSQYGITVNCIAPGMIETDMMNHLTADSKHLKEVVGRIPMQRLGKPEDIIGALLFLCSKESSYITGQTLFIDGGWMAR